MGWLDNSTNNIILDAVLTDYGRQALAKNDGSFRIAKFALGDDEVDYSIITKYGRTVGREKIEKNTPVFEAFTNQNLGLKYKMISVPRPLLYLPSVELISPSAAIELTPGGNTPTQKITVEQKARGGESTIEADLQETNFDVYVPDMFLDILNTTPIGSPDVNKIALYNLSATKGTLQFEIRAKSIASTSFTVYGRLVTVSNSSKRVISTSVKVVGKSSGAVLEIPVKISRTI